MKIRTFVRMTLALAASTVVACTLGSVAALAEAACAAPEKGIGVARVVEIDTSGGPIYGAITKFTKEESFLGPKEVVLTFDDGPSPAVTRPVLATLDAFCTKATFFQVGRMAIAYPDMVKEILGRGHTVGSHTWSHPLSLSRLKPEAARDEIERGFAAIGMAAGRPIAPFFRFPGLGDSQQLLNFLQTRKVATFTVDVISNDSFISSTDRLIKTTLERVEQRQGGIILFHDIKPQTAKALPVVLAELKARGYKVVHLRSKHGFEPDLAYAEALRPMLAKNSRRGDDFASQASGQMSPSAPLLRGYADGDRLPVTSLAPAARPITIAVRQSTGDQRPRHPIVYGGWNTTVRKSKPNRTEIE